MKKVYSGDQGDIVKAYRLIPDDAIINTLEKGEDAFLHDEPPGSLKRQTIWKAAKRLSEKMGRPVGYAHALFRLRSGEDGEDLLALEGYSFYLEDQESQHQKDTAS